MGAYLHDVGKVKVPHQILNKPGKLTDDEFAIIKRHPVWGVELLASVEFPWDIKPIIRSHHERYDGNGYPDRLRATRSRSAPRSSASWTSTTRSPRPGAIAGPCRTRMRWPGWTVDRHWWRPDVLRRLPPFGRSGAARRLILPPYI